MMNRQEFFKTLVGGAAGLAAALHAKPSGKPARQAAGAKPKPKTTTSTPPLHPVLQGPPPVGPENFVYRPGSKEIHFYYPQSLTALSEPTMVDITTHSDRGPRFMTYKQNGRFEFVSLVNEEVGRYHGTDMTRQCLKALTDRTEQTFVFHFQEGTRNSVITVRGILVSLDQCADVAEPLKLEGTIVTTGEIRIV
jgi:hypothetical protein